MKKIIVLLFLVVNVFLFFGILEIYEEKDFAYINQIETEQSQVCHEWIRFHDEAGDLDSEKIFDLFQELTNQFNLLISIRITDIDRNLYQIYVSSSMNIDQRLKLVTDVSLNFNESEDSFYTNKKGDAKGQYFYLLNNDMDVYIYPIRYLKKMPDTVISFVADSREDLEDSIRMYMEHFGSYSSRMGEPTADTYETRKKIDSFLPMTILLTMLSSFLLIMMYIHARSKKIAVFHTLGLSLPYTAFKLFFVLLISIFFIIAATNLILFILFVGIINARTILFLKMSMWKETSMNY